MKASSTQYRNINGKYFEVYTTNPSDFNDCKIECKKEGVAFRVIDNQFYKEVK